MKYTNNKYTYIKNILKDKIIYNELTNGESIPSEFELMKEYDVSRITARRAVDELSKEGYINKIQGKGCFVTNTINLTSTKTIQSFTEKIIALGKTPTKKIISIKIRRNSKKELLTFELNKPCFVMHFERIYYADEEAFCLSKSVVPFNYFKDIIDLVENNSLYSLIENEYNTKITYANLDLSAISATKAISDICNVEFNSPIIYSKGVTYGIINNKEVPIEIVKTYYLMKNYQLKVIKNRF